MSRFSGFLSLACLVTGAAAATVFDFAELGGVTDDDSSIAEWRNGGLVNDTLARMQPGDTLLFPEGTFYVMGGITATVGPDERITRTL